MTALPREALAPSETARLVGRALAGERSAFATLVRCHLRAAYSVALAVSGRPADAEDIAQDALVSAFEKLATCQDPSRFSGWLLRIVRNRALNFIAARALRDGPPPGDDAPHPDEGADHALGTAELRRRLMSALSCLEPTRREVVLLHDLAGCTHPEIALAIGCSETMSRQHLFLARRALRDLLGADPAPSLKDDE